MDCRPASSYTMAVGIDERTGHRGHQRGPEAASAVTKPRRLGIRAAALAFRSCAGGWRSLRMLVYATFVACTRGKGNLFAAPETSDRSIGRLALGSSSRS